MRIRSGTGPRMIASLARDLRFASGLLRTLGRVKGIEPGSPRRICDDLEAAVRRWRDREALRFDGRSLTYGAKIYLVKLRPILLMLLENT